MTGRELRASVTLASIFALRMLGLFLILPVFAVHARTMPGGESAALVGFALGAYGLTQAVLHLPLGLLSDRVGRKPVIVAGLVLFALGSAVAALSETVAGVAIGRSIQGAGAISAALTAFIADSTRDSQRTKAMAMVGASIGLTFAISLVLAPLAYAAVGLAGLFWGTGALALGAIVVTLYVVPDASDGAPAAPEGSQGVARLGAGARDADLLRLNFGIFVLHCVQMAMFVVVPGWLVERAGVPLAEHWKIYLAVLVLSFLLIIPPLFWSERKGRLRAMFLSAVVLLACVAAALATEPTGLVPMAGLLLAFFAGFNILEASLPSLVSRLAPASGKGAALGLYNTAQALGLFAGGALGGWLQSRWGGGAVFLMCAVLLVVWLAAASGQRRWPGRERASG
jgi:MFS family permease